jgi:hypothetical protein
MQPQKIALSVIMLLGALQLVMSVARLRGAGQRGLKILIKAQSSAQLAEGLIRYLMWELALWRGLDVEISLVVDESCEEMRAIEAIMRAEGLLEPPNGFDPDLTFVL